MTAHEAPPHRAVPVLHRRDYFRGWTGGIRAIRVESQSEFRPHGHDFLELVFVLSGTGRHETVYGDRALSAGQVIALYPGEWHAYRDCRDFRYYNLIFTREFLQATLSWTHGEPVLAHLLWAGRTEARRTGATVARLPPAALARCAGWLDRIDRIQRQTHTPDRRCRLVAALIEVLGELAAALPARSRRIVGAPHPAVVRAAELLETRFAEAWDLPSLAAAVRLHPSYLVRLFRQHTGLAPFGYLRKTRLERAAALLRTSAATALEVLLACGFEHPSHFARIFREHFGVCPREFRRQAHAAALRRSEKR